MDNIRVLRSPAFAACNLASWRGVADRVEVLHPVLAADDNMVRDSARHGAMMNLRVLRLIGGEGVAESSTVVAFEEGVAK